MVQVAEIVVGRMCLTLCLLGMALAPWNVLAAGKIRTDEEEAKRRETGESEKKVIQVKKEDVPLDAVVADGGILAASEGGEDGEYESRSDVIVRARRIAVDGRVVIERQRITRVLETWTMA